jgi:ATP-dependent Clp protease ATP-binding subunit ClpA
MDYHQAQPMTRAIDFADDIATCLSRKLIGQPAAIAAIVPYVQMYRAMLNPEGRPAGVFLLLGPTGTGKTKTVEALAEVLHGSSKKLLKVDCGEFQMEHEVAKLMGAPPGYLGHRETQPLLNQQKVNGASSESCDLSIVLFDEIEKAALSMQRLLLGIFDKATLRLGDSTSVTFEKTIIFLTSNLGARRMSRELNPEFGFESVLPRQDAGRKLQNIGVAAVRKYFSPEFVNRLDGVVVYQPLGADAMAAICDQQILDLQEHIDRRMGERAFRFEATLKARRFLIVQGTSEQYGARELKRTVQRLLIQPLAGLVAAGEISPGSHIRADLSPRKNKLVIRIVGEEELLPAC